MADNVAISQGTGTSIATDDVSTVHYQKVKIDGGGDGVTVPIIAGQQTAAGSVPVVLASNQSAIPVTQSGTWDEVGINDSGNSITVDSPVGTPTFVRLSDGTAAIATLPVSLASVPSHAVTNAGTFATQSASAGDVAHDAVDSGNPQKIGARAIAHGTNPTAVAAADRTDLLANRAGVPFAIGGHPNIVTIKHTNITAAVTDAAIVTVAGGLKIVVTRITVTLDNASTVYPSVIIGFGAVNTPTAAGVLVSHGGVPAGGGVNVGDGSGMLGVGGDGDDLRVTTVGAATGNGMQICVSYYTIES